MNSTSFTRCLTAHVSSGRRHAALGVVALTIAVSCQPSEILEVVDPDVLNVDDYRSPQGADPLRNGVISDWQLVLAGSIDGLIVTTGNMADEIRSTDTFEDRLSVSSRTVIENNPAMLGTYRNLHRVHAAAERAIPILKEFTPDKPNNIAELYALRGLSEIFFAELWCSGVPFSQEDGVTTEYGMPETTTQILNRAVASFDTAMIPAVTDARIRNIAALGKGRALLNLGIVPQMSGLFGMPIFIL